MIKVTVKIQSLEDALKGVAILNDSPPVDEYKQLGDVTVGVLEGGMQSGKTSLMFLARDKHGEVHYFEMSADNFEGVAAAVKGARERFKDT